MIKQSIANTHDMDSPYPLAHLTKEELARRLEDPPLLSTELHPLPHLEPSANGSKHLRYFVSDLDEYKAPSFFLDQFIVTKSVAGLVGAPDSGKSMFARHLAVSTALGLKDFVGIPLRLRHNRAIYLSTEDTKEWNAFMFTKQARGLGYDRKDLTRLELIGGIEMDGGLQMLNATDQSLRESPADIVVVDTFGDAFMGKESNSSTEVRRTITLYGALASQHDTVVLFIHHLRKDAATLAPDQAHVLGSQAFAAKTRIMFDLRVEKGTTNRFLTIVKGNYVTGVEKQKMRRLSLNEETGLYSDTGDRVEWEEISTPQDAKVDWEKIFTLSSELPTKTLIDRLMSTYGIQQRRAQQLIEGLERVRHGVYKRP
jgi:RecA/RadA recombinase